MWVGSSTMGSLMREESSGTSSMWDEGSIAGEDIEVIGVWKRRATAWGIPDMG